jgi:hypothetical protein
MIQDFSPHPDADIHLLIERKKSEKSMLFLSMPIDSVFHFPHPACGVNRAEKQGNRIKTSL